MTHPARAGLALALFLLAAPAGAGWHSLEAVSPPRREGDTLVFRGAQGVAALTVLGPEVVRVRFAPGPALGRDHSYAVVEKDHGPVSLEVRVEAERTVVTTTALRVTVTHDPFRVSFATAAGESLDEDDPERGIAAAGREVRVWKRLREDEHVYGLGEKTGDLDRRGRKLGGTSVAMWNSDTPAYTDATDPLYVSVPFYMVLRQGRAHGIFLDNTFRSSFDVGHASPDLLSFGAAGGELDYYFLDGPTPKDVVRRYTRLTGRTPLPPLWALGYHQCRYSYYPESRVRFLADSFRERRVPADVIWLDIHYLDGFRPFTWDRERFPDPAGLISDLRQRGFRVVTIVDPHPQKLPGSVPYDTGLAGDHFVRRADGSIYEAPVWPSFAERNPGPSVFPDFSRPGTRDWWGGLYASLLEAGVAGIWNDMNEPAVFHVPSGTMPLDVRHDNEGQPTDHREIHNVYGQLMTRSTREGLLRLRPDHRPFVLTRATFAGGQRHAALWPGDNVADWSHLRASLPLLANLGLSGFAFVGSDIGGFVAAPTPELFTRWLQMGVFYPFMRTHTEVGSPEQEPWSHGLRHEAANRRAIELRYELLPTVYNVMEEASRTGLPALRPLLLEYPDDPQTYGQQEEVLFGRDLLVAPVLREGEAARDVYLPDGEWFDLWTDRRHVGPGSARVGYTLETFPVLVRGGAFLFRQPVVQHTGEMAGASLEVHAYPAPSSEGSLYEDDGETRAHERGVSVRRTFRQERSGGRVRLSVGAPEGPYRPPARNLLLLVHGADAPRSVRLHPAGPSRPAAAERLDEGALGAAREGWTVREDGVVVVKVPDTFQPLDVTLER